MMSIVFTWTWVKIATIVVSNDAMLVPSVKGDHFSCKSGQLDHIAALRCQSSGASVTVEVAVLGSVCRGFQARSRDRRGGRWSWTLTFSQKRSWVGRWSWAEQVGRLLLRVVQVVHQQRCNGHCLSDSVQHSGWKSNCTVHKSLGNGEGTAP